MYIVYILYMVCVYTPPHTYTHKQNALIISDHISKGKLQAK